MIYFVKKHIINMLFIGLLIFIINQFSIFFYRLLDLNFVLATFYPFYFIFVMVASTTLLYNYLILNKNKSNDVFINKWKLLILFIFVSLSLFYILEYAYFLIDNSFSKEIFNLLIKNFPINYRSEIMYFIQYPQSIINFIVFFAILLISLILTTAFKKK